MINDSTNKTTTSKPKGRPPKSASVNKGIEVASEKIQEVQENEDVKDTFVDEIKEEAKVAEKEMPPVKKEKKTFEDNDSIICRSVVSGRLYMDGLVSKMPYTWTDFGDEVAVEYRDLVAAVRVKNNYVMKPFFVIMDDDFVALYPFLKEVYNGQYSIKDLAKILTLPVDEMKSAIKELPGNIKDTLKGIASTQVSSGRLDSFKKIKVLDELLDTELNLIAEMNE